MGCYNASSSNKIVLDALQPISICPSLTLWAHCATFPFPQMSAETNSYLGRPNTAHFHWNSETFHMRRQDAKMADTSTAFQQVCETFKIFDLSPCQWEAIEYFTKKKMDIGGYICPWQNLGRFDSLGSDKWDSSYKENGLRGKQSLQVRLKLPVLMAWVTEGKITVHVRSKSRGNQCQFEFAQDLRYWGWSYWKTTVAAQQ